MREMITGDRSVEAFRRPATIFAVVTSWPVCRCVCSAAVKQQAEHVGWQSAARPTDRASMRSESGSTRSDLDGGVDGGLRDATSVAAVSGGSSRLSLRHAGASDLLAIELRAARVREQSVEASDNVAQVKAGRRRAAGPAQSCSVVRRDAAASISSRHCSRQCAAGMSSGDTPGSGPRSQTSGSCSELMVGTEPGRRRRRARPLVVYFCGFFDSDR